MARADLITKLAAAAVAGDRDKARRLIKVLAADERGKRHSVFAEQLDALVAADEGLFSLEQRGLDDTPDSAGSVPIRELESLALASSTRDAVDAFLEEQHFGDALRLEGVPPRHRLLLTGPPGTGKTSLAQAIASTLKLPMATVEYQHLIGSFLGKTGADLSALFHTAAAVPSVLFFDEFETLAKERSDVQDLGEMKRVVSTLMLLIDSLPSHVVLVAATNHPDMLDVAVWRRFQLHLELPLPIRSERSAWGRRRAAELQLSNPERVIRRIREADDRPYSWIEEQLLAAKRADVLVKIRSAGK